MSFNIAEERTKLIQVINDNAFNFFQFSEKNVVLFGDPRTNFLWLVLTLTIKYPQVELHLKNLLNYFTIDELKNLLGGWSILHYVCRFPSHISLNSFEIIINYCMNINIKTINNSTVAHILFYNQCDNHIYNILNLLIKYSINLNIINWNNCTVLDELTRQNKLNEETKNCIMTTIDSGGRTNNPIKNNEIYDFIEYYKYSTIKPAIKK